MYRFKERNLGIYDFILLGLLLVAAILESKTISSILQIILILKSLSVRHVSIIGVKELLVVAMLGVDTPLIIFPILYFISFVVIRKGRIGKDYHKSFILIILYSLVIALISFVNEFLILNTILWVLMFSTPFCFYFYAKEWDQFEKEKDVLLLFVECILIVQLLCVLYQAVTGVGFTPSDLISGTAGEAHRLGVILFTFVFYGFFLLKNTRFRISSLLLIFICLAVEYLSDSKAIILSSALACFILLHFSIFSTKYHNVLIEFRSSIVSLFLVYFIFVSILFFDKSIFDPVYDFFEPYIHGSMTSSKYKLYVSVWHDMFFDYPFQWFFGTGPGTLASRASNMLSADVLAKSGEMASLLPISSSYWTREYMDGLYTYEILDNIKWVSAVLTYPFSGFISLKAELGIVGISMYLYVVYRISFPLIKNDDSENVNAFKKGLFVSTMVFLTALLFDNYHGQLALSASIFILIGAFSHKNKIRNHNLVLCN